MDGFVLVKQGAEARIYEGKYLGKPSIAKERFSKKYRHPNLDALLTKERIKAESRAIVKCKAAGIRTPAIYLVDFTRRIIFMEYFTNSMTVKDFIEKTSLDEVLKLSFSIGEALSKMHQNNIVHGDLTSSNMLLVNTKNENKFDQFKDLELVFIDFGLAHTDSGAEDKGVDLYVLERALISTHKVAEEVFVRILDGYKKHYKNGSKEVLSKYEEVRARGRKRTMIG